jgi:hypothetical protein
MTLRQDNAGLQPMSLYGRLGRVYAIAAVVDA